MEASSLSNALQIITKFCSNPTLIESEEQTTQIILACQIVSQAASQHCSQLLLGQKKAAKQPITTTTTTANTTTTAPTSNASVSNNNNNNNNTSSTDESRHHSSAFTKRRPAPEEEDHEYAASDEVDATSPHGGGDSARGPSTNGEGRCRVCQRITGDAHGQPRDENCAVCYTALWRDARRVVARVSKAGRMHIFTGERCSDLEKFSHEAESVGRPCLTSRNSCPPEAYRCTQPGTLICTRCRTKASVRLCPELSFRLLESALQTHNKSTSAISPISPNNKRPRGSTVPKVEPSDFNHTSKLAMLNRPMMPIVSTVMSGPASQQSQQQQQQQQTQQTQQQQQSTAATAAAAALHPQMPLYYSVNPYLLSSLLPQGFQMPGNNATSLAPLANMNGINGMAGMGVGFPSGTTGTQPLPSNLTAAAAANMLSPFMFGGMGADAAAAAATMMNWAAAAQGLGVVGAGGNNGNNANLVAPSQQQGAGISPSCRIGMNNVGPVAESVAQ